MTAYTDLTVRITPEIIERSEQRNSSHCMIAEAIREAAPGIQAVSVDIQTIRFTDRQMRMRMVYLTPRSAQLALVKFDQGEPTEPFVIKLRNPHYVPITQRRKTTAPSASATPPPAVPPPVEVSAEGGECRPPSTNPTKKAKREAAANPATASGGVGGGRPRRQGGSAPPTAALVHRSGQRREFGLKSLVR